MKIIGYARVSSREQAENSHALEQQIARLEAAGASKVYSDVESGNSDKRPQFNAVMDLVKAGDCIEVVITRLDRLSRKLATLCQAADAFSKSGVNLRALDEQIDLSTAAGKFYFNMLGSVAQMQRDQLREKVKHGWDYVRKQEKAKNAPFGYKRENDCLVLNHDPYKGTDKTIAEVAREIIETFMDIGTVRGTQRALSCKYPGVADRANTGKRLDFPRSCTGLINWLASPVLRGHLVYYNKGFGNKAQRMDRTIIYNKHLEQALITESEFEQIDEFLNIARQRRGWGSNAPKNLFSGIIWCAECKKRCFAAKPYRGTAKETRYYNCKRYQLGQCSQKRHVREEIIEPLVIQALIQRAETITNLASLPPENTEPIELKELRSQLYSLEAIPNPMDAIETAKQALRLQIQNFQHELGQEQQAKSGNQELLLEMCNDQPFWRTLPPEEKREIYRKLVDRVVIKNGAVESISLKV